MLNKAKGHMFRSVGWTWSPIAGCSHNCRYCWAASLMKRWGKTFEPQLRERFFKDKMPNDGSWIFVGSMGDTFCDGVPSEWILKLIEFIKNDQSNNLYLLQTKNPRRFEEFNLEEIKDKIIVGTTLETTGDTTKFSKAPSTIERYTYLRTMKQKGFKTFLSLEPLADFDFNEMMNWIINVEPEAVEIGLENYTHYTTPPSEEKIKALIYNLEALEISYVLKENLEHLYNIGTDTVKSSQIGIDIQDG